LIKRNESVTCSYVDAVAQALADPIRREILRMLRDQPMNAGEIAGAFSVSRPAISRHLRVLREAGLVIDESMGRERTYRLRVDALAELEAYLAELRAPLHAEKHAPSQWERRFLALETEVQRVKRRRRRAAPTRVRQSYKQKETA
jgi:DNA-binding transcriptional ArsR family regulator